MKKNKIIGLLVALGGTAVSIASAAALYTSSANDVTFDIGIHYTAEEGTINYSINGTSSGTVTPSYLKSNGTNGGTGLGGEYTQIDYVFELGAAYTSHAQDYVVGNFEVNLTNISSALQNKAKIWVETKGYSDNTVGKHQFSKFMNEDTVLTGATYSIDKDICVATSGTQKVHVYIKLNEALTGAEALALAESKACDISVTWGSVKDYDFAYVVGNFNMWEDDEAYAMVPNINAEAYDVLTFEWYYKGLSADGKAKCRQGTTWSADPDANLVSTKTYNVYWNGKGASVANFAEAA